MISYQLGAEKYTILNVLTRMNNKHDLKIKDRSLYLFSKSNQQQSVITAQHSAHTLSHSHETTRKVKTRPINIKFNKAFVSNWYYDMICYQI